MLLPIAQKGIGKAPGEDRFRIEAIGQDNPCNRRGGAMDGGPAAGCRAQIQMSNPERIFRMVLVVVTRERQPDEKESVEAAKRH